MTPPDAGTAALDRECTVYARYLSGRRPTPYVLRKYRDGHRSLPAPVATTFDRAALALSRAGVPGVALADAYTRWFRQGTALRLKLTLLLAILENTPPYHAELTRCRTGARSVLVARLVWSGLLFAATLAGAVLVLGPLHLFGRSGARS